MIFILNGNTAKCFVLSNALTADSALDTGDRILATDGISQTIHKFDTHGHLSETVDTLRPYRRLRKNAADGGYSALSCCGARLYYLDTEFVETGYTDLETDICDCGSIADTASDASVACIGSERFIIAAFDRGAYLYGGNGKRITRLCEADRNERITDFVHPSSDFYAMSVTRGELRTVSVSDGGKIQTAISDGKYRLKLLIPTDGGLDGLFSVGYLYNKIIPIYRNGILELPKE